MKEKQEGIKSNIRIWGIIILLLITIAIVSSYIIFAWSKYSTTIKGRSLSQVAKWSFKVNGSTNEIATINLADTKKGFDQNVEVQEGTIAPGTQGGFTIELDATDTDVSLEYDINMNINYIDNEQFPKNLIFYSDSEMKNAIYYEDNIININGIIEYNKNNMKKNIEIYWKWDFETGQTQDDKNENNRADSIWMGKNILLPITVLGKQINEDKLTNEYPVTFNASGGAIKGYGNSEKVTKRMVTNTQYGELLNLYE